MPSRRSKKSNKVATTTPDQVSNSSPQATVEDVEEYKPVTEEIGDPPTDATNDTLAKAANLIKQQQQLNKLSKANPPKSADNKAKKAFEGLGLVLVPNITRVVFKRTRNDLIVIQDPEVYKSSTSDVYIVYGQASIQKNPMPNFNFKNPSQMLAKAGLNNPAAQARALATLQAAASSTETTDDVVDDPDDVLPELADDLQLDDDAPNPTGVSDKEISMVMKQAGVSRGKAISAINSNAGDIASAIMSLTE